MHDANRVCFASSLLHETPTDQNSGVLSIPCLHCRVPYLPPPVQLHTGNLTHAAISAYRRNSKMQNKSSVVLEQYFWVQPPGSGYASAGMHDHDAKPPPARSSCNSTRLQSFRQSRASAKLVSSTQQESTYPLRSPSLSILVSACLSLYHKSSLYFSLCVSHRSRGHWR